MSGKGASDFGCGNRPPPKKPGSTEDRDLKGASDSRVALRVQRCAWVRARGKVRSSGASGAQSGPGPEFPLRAGGLSPPPAPLASVPLPSVWREALPAGLNQRCARAAVPVWTSLNREIPYAHRLEKGLAAPGHPLTSCPMEPGRLGLNARFPAPDDVKFAEPWAAHDGAKSQTRLQELHRSPTSLTGSGGRVTSTLCRANRGCRPLTSKSQI